jgi:hypothetical protein
MLSNEGPIIALSFIHVQPVSPQFFTTSAFGERECLVVHKEVVKASQKLYTKGQLLLRLT